MASIEFTVECEIERDSFGDIVPSSVMAQRYEIGFGRDTRYSSHDLLDGLDLKAREQVIHNICRIYGSEIDEAHAEDQ